MTDEKQTINHAQAESLLPWLVNGTLDDEEQRQVTEHLDTCSDCRAAVEELSILRSRIRKEPATPLLPEPNVPGLMARLDSLEKRRSPRLWASAAAVAAVVLSGVFFATQNSGDGPATFRTATSSSQADRVDYVLDVTFVEGSSLATHRNVLEKIDANVVEQGSAGNSYRVTVRLAATSMDELDDYLRTVEAMDPVQTASVVAIQLPVSSDP